MVQAANSLNTLLLPAAFDGLELRRCVGTSGPPAHFHAECQIAMIEAGNGVFAFG